jgi:hypothetical protein
VLLVKHASTCVRFTCSLYVKSCSLDLQNCRDYGQFLFMFVLWHSWLCVRFTCSFYVIGCSLVLQSGIAVVCSLYLFLLRNKLFFSCSTDLPDGQFLFMFVLDVGCGIAVGPFALDCRLPSLHGRMIYYSGARKLKSRNLYQGYLASLTHLARRSSKYLSK